MNIFLCQYLALNLHESVLSIPKFVWHLYTRENRSEIYSFLSPPRMSRVKNCDFQMFSYANWQTYLVNFSPLLVCESARPKFRKIRYYRLITAYGDVCRKKFWGMPLKVSYWKVELFLVKNTKLKKYAKFQVVFF